MYNGATLSDEVPIEKFTQIHQSKPFNPILVNVFYKCGFIENWGRGTLNIIDDCIKYGLPKPTFEYEWTAVRVTFYKLLQKDKKMNVGLNELFEFIQDNQPVRVSSIKEHFNVTTRTIERWIKQLREEKRREEKRIE